MRREAAKKRRLKPLRKLFAEVPRLIKELKPCLLMSPITVAMLLDPEVYTFDLVVFDGLTQIAPEEAAGAIVRGVQTIIVGDKMRLPPAFLRGGRRRERRRRNTSESEAGRVFDSILRRVRGAESEGVALALSQPR
ncbi:MAG: hypothetical protein U0559_00220 [Anaerolineae bacterium]